MRILGLGFVRAAANATSNRSAASQLAFVVVACLISDCF